MRKVEPGVQIRELYLLPLFPNGINISRHFLPPSCFSHDNPMVGAITTKFTGLTASSKAIAVLIAGGFGSTYPEKIVFEGYTFQTTWLNEGVRLISS